MLPDIQKAKHGKSFKNSIDRNNGITCQENYDKQVDEFKKKLKDPLFKNNSSNVQGIIAGGGSPFKDYGNYI